ncbi:MAG: phosphoribosylformylglycinamidine cyclo-ligase [Candidatus Thermoplasmatota archaeon]|nr:phosphoribosylformylglycinamidine cyclo-ligase [Candidatus Thermoplasmatota archaeon]
MAGPEGENPVTYAGSGVDIVEEGKAIRGLISALKFRREGFGALADLGGHFTGIVDFGEHYLSLCTDGVGSKLMIAEELGKWDTVGIDCMAMNVNDVICIGAEPLAFVDYIATTNPDPETLEMVGIGLNEGARQANLTIIGGETASLPEMVRGLDLAGTCLGFVKKSELIKGDRTSPGDLIIGFPSSGLHSNGFSLVRKVMMDNDISYISPLEEVVARNEWKNRKRYPAYKEEVERWAASNGASVVGDILLTPTRIYVKDVLGLLKGLPSGCVHGMANITGGGFRNISRIRSDVLYKIDEPFEVPPVFRMVQVLGSIDETEMYQTLNMGLGFVIILAPEVEETALEHLSGTGARRIGHVLPGKGVIIEPQMIHYDGYV